MSISGVIDKQALRELCRPRDAKAWFDLLLRIGGEALLFGLAVYFLDRSLPVALVFFYLAAVWHGFWGYAGIGHELSHGRVFNSPTLNRVLYRAASYLTWNNPSFFAKAHGYHHRHTFADDDGEALSTQEWGPAALFGYITVDLPLLLRRLFYVLVNAAGFIPRDGRWSALEWTYQRDAIAMLVFNLAIHAALALSLGDWRVNLLWFLLPFTGQVFNRLLAQSQHIGLAGFKAEGPLKHSRTIKLPWLFEFLYAGMNFHVEHHLVPAVPYYRLTELNALLVQRGLLAEVQAQPYFLREIWVSIRELRRG